MPRDDLVEAMFRELSAADLPVPARAAVLARGRQRRTRTRLTAAACALAVVALAGSALGYARHAASARPQGPVSQRGRGAHHRRPDVPAVKLPPAGTGPLLLSLREVQGASPYWDLVMTRLASTARPVALPSPPAWADFRARIATDPAGGWVISYATTRPNALGQASQRLATVSASGRLRPFGQAFGTQLVVTGLAVRSDGSAVAVALADPYVRDKPAQIELMPLPGRQGPIHIWRLAAGGSVANMAESLSWAPGGTLLTYIPGSDGTGGGFAGRGAATLNTTVPSATAPSTSAWPPFGKKAGQCALRAGTWQAGTGLYIALEQCTGGDVAVVAANYRTGAREGTATQLAGGPHSAYYGCGQPLLAPAPAGSDLLLSGCGLYLYSSGHISAVGGSLAGATFWDG